jgi:hypothetical protein
VNAQQFLQLVNARRIGKERWRGFCPVHGDRHRSLDVGIGVDGRVLLICRSHACDVGSICQALGLRLADLFPDRNPTSADWARIQRERAKAEVMRLREEATRRSKNGLARDLANIERVCEQRALEIARERWWLLGVAAAARASWFAMHGEPEQAQWAEAESKRLLAKANGKERPAE